MSGSLNGLIVINKPLQYTSHDVVSVLRKLLHIKAVGHTGTLDPMVDGVLPIAIGKATKLSDHLQCSDKVYEGEIMLGSSTTTQDHQGEVLKKSDFKPSLEEIESQITTCFIGEISQIPPMYSAVKHKGKKLYEYARKDLTLEIEPRKRMIHEFNILNYEYPYLSFRCRCSSGTYVRTIAHDLGEKIGSFAHLYQLTRTEAAGYQIQEAFTLDEIEKNLHEKNNFIIPMNDIRLPYEAIQIEERYFQWIIQGKKIPLYEEKKAGLFRLICNDHFMGLGEVRKEDKTILRVKRMLYME